jgi:hypothetical protein
MSITFNHKGDGIMNKTTMLAAFATLSMAAMPIYAVDEHHPEKAQQAAAPMEAQPEAVADRQIMQARETMRKLQEQMGKIRQTSDPKERQKLMREHMQTMQEGMKQLRGMGGMKRPGGMMGMSGGGKQGGMMMGMGGGDKPGGGMMMGDMMKAHEMMDMRMEMMETMMEHMMQREEMREAMPKK